MHDVAIVCTCRRCWFSALSRIHQSPHVFTHHTCQLSPFFVIDDEHEAAAVISAANHSAQQAVINADTANVATDCGSMFVKRSATKMV
jgi:hypothetical protein